MEWAEETIVRLRSLWDEGHSTAEIGRRLGVSKNAVVGKAHRLDLPARPSPIRRDGVPGGAPRRTAPRRVAGPTLPPLYQHARSIAPVAHRLSLAHVATLAPKPSPVAPLSGCCRPVPRPYGRSSPAAGRSASPAPAASVSATLVRTWEAVLFGPREACLREGARPPRRRRLTAGSNDGYLASPARHRPAADGQQA